MARSKDQSRMAGLRVEVRDPNFIAPDALENAKERAKTRIRSLLGDDLIAANAFNPVRGIGSDYAASLVNLGYEGGWGPMPFWDTPPPAPIADLPVPPEYAPTIGGKKIAKQQRQMVRRAIVKNIPNIRINYKGPLGSEGGSRGGYTRDTSASTYGSAGYQGGTYGGAAGRSITEGVGQAFKNR